MQTQTFAYIALFAGGYVAAIFSWDWIHTQIVGAQEKAKALKEQAIALEQKFKGML